MAMPGIPKQTVDLLLKENADHNCGDAVNVCVRIVAVADLPTLHGDYQVVAFWNNYDLKEHAAFVHGDVFEREDVPVRLHSECVTGDAIGSLRCDCGEQLQQSLKAIGAMEHGIVIYMRQEGRGIGLVNKIRAYQLQDSGYDTFQANEALGFKPDERDYDLAAHMLKSLHVKSIRLMTNNVDKIRDLQVHGMKITGRIPVIAPSNRYDSFYLETKRKKAGHLLDRNYSEDFLEQQDQLVDNHHHNETK